MEKFPRVVVLGYKKVSGIENNEFFQRIVIGHDRCESQIRNLEDGFLGTFANEPLQVAMLKAQTQNLHHVEFLRYNS